MKAIVAIAAVLLIGTLRPDAAHAWASANRWGGSTSHSWGSTSHTNAYGGSSSHTYGEGTEHTNMYGGSSAHAWGGGSEHTNAYGGSTYGAYRTRCDAHLCLGSDGLSPARLRWVLRVSSLSPAGRGAVLLGNGLLRLRGRCRCDSWCNRRVGRRRGGRQRSGPAAGGIRAALRAGGVCGFATRLHLPVPAACVRVRRNVVRPRLWRERRVLPCHSATVNHAKLVRGRSSMKTTGTCRRPCAWHGQAKARCLVSAMPG